MNNALRTKCFSFFSSHNEGYETQKELRLGTQAIILDWQHTF